MRRSKVFALVSCAAVGATAFWFVAAQASTDGPYPQFPMLGAIMSGNRMLGAMSAKLNLSDGQKSEIRTIVNTERAKDAPTVDRLKQDSKSLRAMAESNTVDQIQLTAVAHSTSATAIDLVVDLARAKSRIYTVLTPDQRIQAKEMQAKSLTSFRENLSTMQNKQGRMMAFVAARLDLNDDQKSQALAILATERAAIRPNVAEIALDLKGLQPITQSGSFNEPAVRAQAQKAQQPLEALLIDTIQTRSQLYALLTPEQKAKAEMMQKTFRSKLAQRILNRFATPDSANTQSVI